MEGREYSTEHNLLPQEHYNISQKVIAIYYVDNSPPRDSKQARKKQACSSLILMTLASPKSFKKPTKGQKSTGLHILTFKLKKQGKTQPLPASPCQGRKNTRKSP